jgi:hypothetical protein
VTATVPAVAACCPAAGKHLGTIRPIALPPSLFCVKMVTADCRLLRRAHSRVMNARYVELVLFEQSLSTVDGITRPFWDRVQDAAEKTAGSVLFDVRVDGDQQFQRIAAIGYGAGVTVAIVMGRDGHLVSATLDGCDDLITEIAAWCSLSMVEQSSISYSGAAARLLAKLRKSGTLD